MKIPKTSPVFAEGYKVCIVTHLGKKMKAEQRGSGVKITSEYLIGDC